MTTKRFSRWRSGCSVGWIACAACGVLLADRAPSEDAGSAATSPAVPYGLEQRKAWTTSNVRGRPEPPLPFRAQRVFSKLTFASPTVLTSAPGTRRLFVAEQKGKIYSIPDDPNSTQADLMVDVQQLVDQLGSSDKRAYFLDSVYGLTFHPEFAKNRLCYVCYVVGDKNAPGGIMLPDGTRVVSLRVSDDPPRCDPKSETLIISWLQGGHNGGCLKFGPDGYLYVSTGDGGSAFPPDGLNTGQDLSDLLASILRIDVDRREAGRAYAIPADNPFVSLPKVRGEVWAYGLRNPWKMSFDRHSGELWIGDVGWELWELVYRAKKGANCGWSLVEGRQPVHPEGRRGPTPVVSPTVEIPHIEGASITGGFVYRGTKFPELVGTYIFGDWETRRIWGVTVEADKVGGRRELVEPTVRVVDFAEDSGGELFLLDYDQGTIHELVRSADDLKKHRFPRRLSETGLFDSVAEHQVAPGVIPFSINAEAWADYALAERFVAVPSLEPIKVHARPQQVPGSQFSRTMEFPADTVLMKTLALEMTQGEAASRRKIETQLLHYDGRDWRGYTYRWNDEQTDADLVRSDGDARTLQITDREAPGGRRLQSWRFASRAECARCHNPWAEHALAFNIHQLNRDHDDELATDNQIAALRHIGLLQDVGQGAEFVPKPPEELPRLVNPHLKSADLERRARSYLHVNCAHCHRFGGGGSAYVHLPFDVPIAEMKAVGQRPAQGTFGIPDAHLIAPGDPYHSVLYFRMAKAGPGHMPQIGSSIVDRRGLSLLRDWIRDLQARDDEEIERFSLGLSGDDRRRAIEEQLGSLPRAMRLAHIVREKRVPERVRQVVLDVATNHADSAVRDLFEPLLPDHLRSRRLGDEIHPEEILKLTGDVERGRKLFHDVGSLQCRNCHRIGDNGASFGPDLDAIGKKYDRAKLLENIVEPSKTLEEQYRTWSVQTDSGQVYSGLLVKKDAEAVVLTDAQNVQHVVPVDEIVEMQAQQQSMMPDLMLRDLTAQQVADLLSFLQSLK